MTQITTENGKNGKKSEDFSSKELRNTKPSSPYSRRLKRIFSAFICALGILALIVGVCAALNLRSPGDRDVKSEDIPDGKTNSFPEAITIRVVTFNIWDLLPVGTHRAERMEAIVQTLAPLQPDLIGFQEAFHENDRAILAKGLKSIGLEYSHYFSSGLVGSGLFIVSRYPIEVTFFHRFTSGGKWYKPWHGDWWAGKGIAMVRVKLPQGGYLHFYDTHGHANYGGHEYDKVVASNLEECAAFIRKSSVDGIPTIVTGDFNCTVTSSQFSGMREKGQLVRAMKADSRIDHILTRRDESIRWKVLSTIPVQGKAAVAGKDVSLSDHPGYLSELSLSGTMPKRSSENVTTSK